MVIDAIHLRHLLEARLNFVRQSTLLNNLLGRQVRANLHESTASDTLNQNITYHAACRLPLQIYHANTDRGTLLAVHPSDHCRYWQCTSEQIIHSDFTAIVFGLIFPCPMVPN